MSIEFNSPLAVPQEPQRQALVGGGAGQLGHRPIRISDPGAGQPHRPHRARPRPAQDHAGGHHPAGVRALRRVLHAPALQVGFCLGRPVPARRGVFHLPGISAFSAPCQG